MRVAVVGFVLGSLAGCAASQTPEPGAVAPLPVQPVVCTEQPGAREATITCRYYADEQIREAWERSVSQASTIAVSLGCSHVQWLSSDRRRETAPSKAFTHCWGGTVWRKCETEEEPPQTTALLVVTRFVFLTADEAAARAADPLVPAERRPIDARAALGQRAPARAP
jgi:hypothetical protein